MHITALQRKCNIISVSRGEPGIPLRECLVVQQGFLNINCLLFIIYHGLLRIVQMARSAALVFLEQGPLYWAAVLRGSREGERHKRCFVLCILFWAGVGEWGVSVGLLRAVGPRPGGWGTPFQPALTEGLSCEGFREHVLLVTVDSVPYCIYLQLWEKMQRIVCLPKGPFGVTWTIFSRLH